MRSLASGAMESTLKVAGAFLLLAFSSLLLAICGSHRYFRHYRPVYSRSGRRNHVRH